MAILNKEELNAGIASIRTSALVARLSIQELLISCAYHVAKDGQTTPFNDLLEAVGAGTRKAGIVLWAETYGCVQLEKGRFIINKKAKMEAHVIDEASFAPLEIEIRANKMWYDMLPKENTPSIFKINNYFDSIIKKLGTEEPESLVLIEAAINQYKVAKAMKLAREADEAANEEKEVFEYTEQELNLLAMAA